MSEGYVARAAAPDDTHLSMHAGDTANFSKGSLAQADGSREIILVRGVDILGLVVVRGRYNTTPVAIAAGTRLCLVATEERIRRRPATLGDEEITMPDADASDTAIDEAAFPAEETAPLTVSEEKKAPATCLRCGEVPKRVQKTKTVERRRATPTSELADVTTAGVVCYPECPPKEDE